MTPEGEEIAGETKDPHGERVVLPTRVWNGKVLRDHQELAGSMRDVLAVIATPDHSEPDPSFRRRTRYYGRRLGPSRWLLVVVSYEQTPARIVSAFANRKDPRSWSG